MSDYTCGVPEPESLTMSQRVIVSELEHVLEQN